MTEKMRDDIYDIKLALDSKIKEECFNAIRGIEKMVLPKELVDALESYRFEHTERGTVDFVTLAGDKNQCKARCRGERDWYLIHEYEFWDGWDNISAAEEYVAEAHGFLQLVSDILDGEYQIE